MQDKTKHLEFVQSVINQFIPIERLDDNNRFRIVGIVCQQLKLQFHFCGRCASLGVLVLGCLLLAARTEIQRSL